VNAFDRAVFLGLNGIAGHSGFLDTLGVFFAQDSPYLVAAGFLALWFLLPRQERSLRRRLIQATVAAAVGLLVATVIGSIWYRPRPFVALPAGAVHLLVAHARDSSFPSDHTTFAFAVAAALTDAGPVLSPAAWVLAVLVGVARIFVGVHWPTDVLAGALLGSAIGRLAVRQGDVLDPLVDWALGLFGYGGRRPEREGSA
jgi:undecaprenyl-diphosphatase